MREIFYKKYFVKLCVYLLTMSVRMLYLQKIFDVEIYTVKKFCNEFLEV